MSAEAVAAIRRARSGDAAVLAELSHELGYEVTELDVVERLSSLPMTDEVLVAEVGDAIVGWIHLAAYRTLVDEPAVGIYGLVVTESWRGQGIGRQLIAAADEFAEDRGFHLVTLRSNVLREQAHEFYRKLGFAEVKRQIVFSRPVGGAEGALAAETASAGPRAEGDVEGTAAGVSIEE